MEYDLLDLVKRLETKIDDVCSSINNSFKSTEFIGELQNLKTDFVTRMHNVDDKLESLYERLEEVENSEDSEDSEKDEFQVETESKLNDLDSRLDSLETLDFEKKIDKLEEFEDKVNSFDLKIDIVQKRLDLMFNLFNGLNRRFTQSLFDNHDYKMALVKTIQTEDIKFQDLIKGENVNG